MPTDVYVHEECRKRFNNNKRLSIDETNIGEKRKKHKQDSLRKPSTGKLIVFCVMVFAYMIKNPDEMANLIMHSEYKTKGVQQIKEINIGEASKSLNRHVLLYFAVNYL